MFFFTRIILWNQIVLLSSWVEVATPTRYPWVSTKTKWYSCQRHGKNAAKAIILQFDGILDGVVFIFLLEALQTHTHTHTNLFAFDCQWFLLSCNSTEKNSVTLMLCATTNTATHNSRQINLFDTLKCFYIRRNRLNDLHCLFKILSE